MVGLGANARRELDGYFLTLSYSHFRSSSGDLEGDLFAIGVGDEFDLGADSWLTIHASLHFESDEDPPGNRNSNGVILSVPILRPGLQQLTAVSLGNRFGLTYETAIGLQQS